MINGHKLIIQDKAEGHYPQLAINPHEMTGTEIVITIIMKMGGGGKEHDIFLMKTSPFLKNSCFSYHPTKLLEPLLTLYTVYPSYYSFHVITSLKVWFAIIYPWNFGDTARGNSNGKERQCTHIPPKQKIKYFQNIFFIKCVPQ